MCRRVVGKLAVAMAPVLAGTLWLASVSVAGPGNLGNGPNYRSKAPARATLSTTQALILVQFVNGTVTRVTGTAVPRAKRRVVLGAPRLKTARCNVNFTHSRVRFGNETVVSWFGGVGCDRPLILFGQAYLQQSATNVSAIGTHYEGYVPSAASGFPRTFVNVPNPTLYIRHLVNAHFLASGGTGSIALYPSPGQRINGASVCQVATAPRYGLGVSCDLYSNRF
jgi:hypothetical protein